MALHAFQPRDFFTCSECFSFHPREGFPYCERIQKRIRYDPRAFGCGDYACTDSGDREEPFTLPLTAFRGV